MKAEQAWRATLGQLQMEMQRAAFDTWVRDAEMVSYEDGSFIIGVQNAYARDWLHSRLSSKVTRLLTGMMNRSVEVRFVVWHNTQSEFDSPEPAGAPGQMIPASNYTGQATAHPDDQLLSENTAFPIGQVENTNLNQRYAFENFVVGPSNRLAHAASLAVAEKPALAYNPFFLYGGVGLGKTHLLHAIGNLCIQRGLQVLYVSSEEFTNDLINAIRTHTTQAFRDKYRRIDVLLIDDIQFIAGRNQPRRSSSTPSTHYMVRINKWSFPPTDHRKRW